MVIGGLTEVAGGVGEGLNLQSVKLDEFQTKEILFKFRGHPLRRPDACPLLKKKYEFTVLKYNYLQTIEVHCN